MCFVFSQVGRGYKCCKGIPDQQRGGGSYVQTVWRHKGLGGREGHDFHRTPPFAFFSQTKEAKQFIEQQLVAQINLYKRGEHPFFNAVQQSSDVKVFWQSKLSDAEELAAVALTLLSCAASEAAVERTFSYQKFVEAPLRSRLHTETVQCQLYVRFNFKRFGNRSLVPKGLEESRQLYYNEMPPEEDFEDPEVEITDEADLAKYWNA